MSEPEPADSPWPRRGWYVLGLLATVNFLNYGNRIVLFPMYEDLRASFGFSNAELGLLGTAFMLTHALFTIPLGWAGDRFDRRRVMALGMVVWSLAAIGSAAAAGLGSMLLSRALCGAGTAACVPVANALLCDVFPSRAKARTVSGFNLGLVLGGAAGFGFGAWLGFPRGCVALDDLIAALRGALPFAVERSAAGRTGGVELSMDWTEKYRPSSLSEIRGNNKARDALQEWADTWEDDRKAVILHGSPGIGKTSAAHALANAMGWPTIELNASDSRTKAAAS